MMKMTSRLRTLLRHPLILSYYVPALFLSFSQGILTPTLPLYASDFNVSYSLVGVMLSAQGVGMLVSDVPSGLLLRRLGMKRAMMLGLVCIMLPTAALFWAGSMYEVIVYRFISGFGLALYGISRHTYIAGKVVTTSRGRAIALSGGILRVGRFLGPLVGGLIAAQYGLRVSFLVFALTCGIALAVVIAFVQQTKQPGSLSSSVVGASTHAAGEHHFFAMLKTNYKVLISAGAGQLFAQLIRAARGTIIPLYAADVLGLSVDEIGFVVSIAAAVDMMMFYPAGWIMDNLGRKIAIVPCFAVQAVGMALVPLAGDFTTLMLFTCIIGLGNGLGSGSMMTTGADLAPPQSRGEFLGVWRFIGDAGATGGPTVVGSVADALALPTAALVVAGAGMISALIFAFLVPETLRRKPTIVQTTG